MMRLAMANRLSSVGASWTAASMCMRKNRQNLANGNCSKICGFGWTTVETTMRTRCVCVRAHMPCVEADLQVVKLGQGRLPVQLLCRLVRIADEVPLNVDAGRIKANRRDSGGLDWTCLRKGKGENRRTYAGPAATRVEVSGVLSSARGSKNSRSITMNRSTSASTQRSVLGKLTSAAPQWPTPRLLQQRRVHAEGGRALGQLVQP